MVATKLFRRAVLTALMFGALGAAGVARADSAGEVEYARGVGSIRHAGVQRILGKGMPVEQGDLIVTGDNSFAIVHLADGTRMTVRPSSELLIQTYDFKPAAKEGESAGSMVFNLIRGGLRTVTGLIPKRDSEAAKIRTPVATVGIRGTDFDLRMCGKDCAKEDAGKKAEVHRNLIPTSARVVQLEGNVGIVAVDGGHRILANGGPIYPGDTVETQPRSFAVLVFRDDSRVTVQPNTRFKVEDFVYDSAHPEEGRFLVNLLKGGLRAFTGLIGKTNHSNVSVKTVTATVGIRGTGFDLVCQGSCAGEPATPESDGLNATVWDGSVDLQSAGGTLTVGLGQTANVNAVGTATLTPRPAVLDFTTPRPDTPKPDMQLLFGVTAVTDAEPGLYVVVRDGHVSIVTATEVLNMGKGETGFTDGTVLVRPLNVPLFLDLDRTPIPGVKVTPQGLLDLVRATGVQVQCKR